MQEEVDVARENSFGGRQISNSGGGKSEGKREEMLWKMYDLRVLWRTESKAMFSIQTPLQTARLHMLKFSAYAKE